MQAETDGRLTATSQGWLAREADGVGELEVCGPEMCLGYLDPADNAVAFTAEGWFRTGDLARLGPGGTVTIADCTVSASATNGACRERSRARNCRANGGSQDIDSRSRLIASKPDGRIRIE